MNKITSQVQFIDILKGGQTNFDNYIFETVNEISIEFTESEDYSFRSCVFHRKVSIKGLGKSDKPCSVDFTEAIFKQSLIVRDCYFNEFIIKDTLFTQNKNHKFHNCTFIKKFEPAPKLKGKDLYVDRIKFNNCIFNKIDFSHLRFRNIDFSKSVFNKEIRVLSLDCESLIFNTTTFNSNIGLFDLKKIHLLQFENSVIKDDLVIFNCHSPDLSLIFSYAKFYGIIELTLINAADGLLDFKNAYFMRSPNYENILERYSIILYLLKIKTVEFKPGLFYNVESKHSAINIIDCDISDSLKLMGGYIVDLDFLDVECNNIIIDDWNKSKVKIEYSQIGDFTLKNSYLDYISLKDTEVKKNFSFYRTDIVKGDREVFRLIKHEYLKINNRVEALKFNAREMEVYEKELKKDIYRHRDQYKRNPSHVIYKRLSKKEYRRKIWNLRMDRIILMVNKYSNGHSLRFDIGIIFLVVSSFFIFSILWIWNLKNPPYRWGFEDFKSFIDVSGDFIIYYVRFLNPTHNYDYMDDFTPKKLFYFMDFIGRVVISFGLYQTIQAFRKFGKT